MKKFYFFLFTLCITQIVLQQKAGAQCAKPVVISKAATVCPGGSTTLFTKQDPSLTYLWSNGGTTASITAGAGTYTLTTTDGGGCSQTSDPVVIKEKVFGPVIPSDTPVLCAGQSLTLYSDTGNIWVRKPDLTAATARNEGVGFSIGSKGYIATGTSSGGFVADMWEYDEATEVWTQKADVPGGGRVFATGLAINNKGYVGLGNNAATRLSDWYEYDPFTNIWTAKANYPGGITTGAAGFVVNGMGYVGLGHTPTSLPTTFWSYNPGTDTWTPKAAFPGGGRREPVAFGINGKGYVATGWLNGGANANDCWQYDPGTNTWSAQAALPGSPRRTASAFTIQDHAYVVCGFMTVGGSSNELWEFFNGNWTKKANFPGSPQWGPMSFGLHDKAIVCMGSANNKQIYEYHPNNTVQWPGGSTQLSYTINTPASYSATIQDIEGCTINTSALTVTAANFTTPPITTSSGTTICEGKIDTLFAGGDVWTQKNNFAGGSSRYASGFTLGSTGYYCGGTNATQFWKYDAATDTWSQQANMPMNVGSAPAAAWNGKGWVVDRNRTMWMYNPVYNSWHKKASYAGTAVNMQSGFLLNDKIIVAGGLNAASQALAEVWEYDLVNDTWTRRNDMPFGMAYAPSFALNGKGYIITGNSTRTAPAGPQSADCLQYDPATDSWTVMAAFPGGPRGGAIAFTDGHKAYVGMGNNGPILTDLWQLDPATLTWTRMTNIPRGRYGAVTMVIGHHAYISTGSQPAGGNMDVWQYEMPYNYQWSTGETTRYIKVTQTGDYSVRVSNDEGCSATTPAVHITVQPKTVISTPPQNVTICDASPTGFSVNASGTNITYQWQLNGSNISDGSLYTGTTSNALSVANVNGLGTGLFKCVVTGTCGTETSTAATLTVNPLPVKPVITPGSATTFCNGGSVTLTSSAAAGNAWSNGGTAQAMPVTASGTFTVKVTDGNGCVSPLSDALAVTVNPLPAKPVITPAGATTFCDGGSVTLASSAAAGNIWSNTSATQNINVTTTGAYTVQITDGNGCSSLVSDAVAVTVNPLPAKPVITPGSATTFCNGGSVTLTSSAATGNAWSNGGTAQAMPVTASGTFTVKVTDGNGCVSPLSDALTVTVNPLPFKPVITANSATTFCSGGAVTLSSDAGAGNTWSNGSTTQSNRITASGSYTVQVKDINGCISPVSDAVLVTVNPLPAQPVISASGPLSFCEGNSVTLSSTAAPAYQWSNGSRTNAITVNKSGNFSVRVTDNNGCTSPLSDAATVAVNPLPSGAIYSVGPVAAGNTHYMQLTAPQVTGGTYAWSTGEHTSAIRVTQSGTYKVIVTNAQGCVNNFQITVQLIDLTKIPNTFSPNRDGVNDYWTVKELDQFPNAMVQIFNRNGNKVFEGKGPGLKWDGTSNGHALPAGVYFYVLDLKDGSKPSNGWINLLK